MSENAKTIDDLRAALFSALEGVRDGTLDTDKARAINEIGRTIVDSAKVEVAFLQTTGGDKSSFIEGKPEPQGLPPGITGITRHRIAG